MVVFKLNTSKAHRKLVAALLVCLVSVSILSVGRLYAQEAQEAQQEETMQDQEVPAGIPRAPTPIPPDERQMRYTGEGTRDPFVSLLIHADAEAYKTGLAAMKISEIKVIGIQIGLGTIAIVQGTDGRAYNMKVGDVLLDGKVFAIDSNKVVFEKVVLDSFGRPIDKEIIEYYLHR